MDIYNLFSKFIRLESSGGIILFFTAILALILDNSPYHHLYQSLFHASSTLDFKWLHFSGSLAFWINDLLMVIFFLLVGLEIKREIYLGELNAPRKIMLPGIAALGGMIAPALVYLVFNYQDPTTIHGWAIPTATDIAFALGLISLLGKRVPVGLKLFLMALAIFDDLGAILIIAFFYQAHLSWMALGGICLCMIALISCNRFGVSALWIYMLLGLILWGFFMQSGVHSTLSGVLLAFTVPLRAFPKKDKTYSDKSYTRMLKKLFIPSPHKKHMQSHTASELLQVPLYRLEKIIQPWVAYAILPLFGFANAGVSFSSIPTAQLFSDVSLGIILGLFLGKQLGVFTATYLAIRLKIAPIPKGTTWGMLYAVAIICGVGFTMSLFLGNLTFAESDIAHAALVRFAILAGSFLSGTVGYFLLRHLIIHKK